MPVLDTNILVDLIRKHPGPMARRVVALVRDLLVNGEPLMTTRFNVAEPYVGAELSPNPSGEADRIDELLAVFQILEFDNSASRAYGRINASLRRTGRPAEDMDALIASVALCNGQPLVTRNPRHFQDIPELVVHPVR